MQVVSVYVFMMSGASESKKTHKIMLTFFSGHYAKLRLASSQACHSTEGNRNISTEHNRFKNHNWWETNQLAVYKHERRVV